jgi:hypothetical protein
MSTQDDRLFLLVELLEKRGGMYIHPFTYVTLVSYLSGFNHAMTQCYLNDELGGFTDWLCVRVGHRFSMHWSAVVRDLFADGSAEKAVSVLFELIREYRNDANRPSTGPG